jgi:hypothetical protein
MQKPKNLGVATEAQAGSEILVICDLSIQN